MKNDQTPPRRSTRRHAVCAALAGSLLLATPGLAQDEEARLGRVGERLVFEAEGHQLFASPPSWFGEDQETGLGAQQVALSGDENSTRFEIVPEEQAPGDFTQLYSARIVLEPERDLAEYRQAAAFGFAMGCDGETGQYFLTEEDTDAALAPMVFACGAFIPDTPRYGEGELVVIAFVRTDAGIGVVYEQFRAPAFDGKDTADWPIAAEVLIARAKLLGDSIALEQVGE